MSTALDGGFGVSVAETLAVGEAVGIGGKLGAGGNGVDGVAAHGGGD